MSSHPCLNTTKKNKTSHGFCTNLFLLPPPYSDNALIPVLPHQPHSHPAVRAWRIPISCTVKSEVSALHSSLLNPIQYCVRCKDFPMNAPTQGGSSIPASCQAVGLILQPGHEEQKHGTKQEWLPILQVAALQPHQPFLGEKSHLGTSSMRAVKDKGLIERSEKREICLKQGMKWIGEWLCWANLSANKNAEILGSWQLDNSLS